MLGNPLSLQPPWTSRQDGLSFADLCGDFEDHFNGDLFTVDGDGLFMFLLFVVGSEFSIAETVSYQFLMNFLLHPLCTLAQHPAHGC